MSSTLRRLLGVTVAAIVLGAAAAASSMHRAQLADVARAKAQTEVDAALPEVVERLQTWSRELGGNAARGVSIPAVSQILGQTFNESDREQVANTFRAFEDEEFFKPYAALGPHAFFLGSTVLASTNPKLDALFTPLAEASVAKGTTGGFFAFEGAVYGVGAGRSESTTRQLQHAVLVIAQPVDATSLELVRGPQLGAVVLVGNDDVAKAVSTGAPDAVSKLRALPSDGCCGRKEVAPGVELRGFRDPTSTLTQAETDATRASLGFFGAAGALALVSLIFGFRRSGAGDAEQSALLRETAAQLRQSQEQLQRISQHLQTSGAPVVAAPVTNPGASEEDLGTTRASAQVSRYEVVAPLGEGGMAQVSVAVMRGAEGFKRSFVLKRLRPELVGNPEVVNQFIDEARLGASLVHSNIVPVFDFGRDTEGYFLAQEYILGRDVDALITASKAQRGRALEPQFVALIAQEALKALGYAHTKRNDAGRPMGLVHRDVSPNNLMVSARGELKLLDFGIVKSDDRVTRTQAGIVKGNLFFMSPEQARALAVDHRSDLFSLGMVMACALGGSPLYSGDTMYELVTRAAAGPTDADRQRVRETGGPLAPVVLQALSLNPAERFADAETFAKAIAAALVPATTADLQLLMETLFTDAFTAERRKFSVTA